MKTLPLYFVLAFILLAVCVANAQSTVNLNDAAFFRTKYKSENVWDVQRNPAMPIAGKEWTLYNLKGALDASGAKIDWGNDRYVMLTPEIEKAAGPNALSDDLTNSGGTYTIALRLYESNGKLVKVVSKWGRIVGRGDEGFLYLVENRYGAFFSPSPLQPSSRIKYMPSLLAITKLSQIVNSSEVPKVVENEKPNVAVSGKPNKAMEVTEIVERKNNGNPKAVSLQAKDVKYTLKPYFGVIITKYLGDYSDIIIPDKIGPNFVRAIGQGAFAGNSKLNSVQFGKTVYEIEESAFEDCSNLTMVQLNYGLAYIKTSAFQNTKIKNLIIPSSVKVIGCFAFNHVTTLASLSFCGNAPTIGGDTFGVNWWGNPTPKLKKMDIPKNANGFDSKFWQERGLTEMANRTSAAAGADRSNPEILQTIDNN